MEALYVGRVVHWSALVALRALSSGVEHWQRTKEGVQKKNLIQQSLDLGVPCYKGII